MRKVISVSIPEPCDENWENMTPQEKGRHCDICEKTVFDFTNKTDEQIVRALENDGKLCGRFKTNQLDRELVLTRKSKNSYRSVAASGLFAFLALNTFKSKAQNETVFPTTEMVKPVNHIKGKIATSVLKERVISGTVLDENNLPLPGVNVVIKGTGTGIVTDFDGFFSLKVKKDDLLEISYIGYKTKEVIIDGKTEFSIFLTEDDVMVEGLIVVGYVNSDYEYTPTPEEQAEEKRKYQFRIANNEAFYKRKRKEERAAKKLKRQQKRNRK